MEGGKAFESVGWARADSCLYDVLSHSREVARKIRQRKVGDIAPQHEWSTRGEMM